MPKNTLKQNRLKKNIVALFNKIFSWRGGAAICSNMQHMVEFKRNKYVYGYDIIRYSSLELVAREIYERGVNGNVAELGVYQGDFARCINIAFPDRKLYLFDTFEGFSEKDVNIDENNSYATRLHDFTKTNVEMVLSRMRNQENCIIRKGYFPDTAKDLDDTFSFVSIDADLYEPIYNGLVYFYPKLARGGYIFVHDYNNKEYPGAKVAVKKYCEENTINYFPLSDLAGSAIIMK